MAEVELQGVGKRYANGFEAVQAVDLVVAAGEFVVLVGPSGCGKSTTLRMVAGLESISRGELRIGGRRVNEVPAKDRDVAMVFQSYALYPHMTAFRNMAFALELRKVPAAEIRTRVEAAAARLDIMALLDRKPAEMSGGQRQRVAMGRAIVREPKVFLFDEPLSNLDAKLRLKMRVEVARLHRSLGATSLYVTHDQVEAMTLADRIVLMKAGAVQQLGPPLELYHRPVNLFTATFLGSPTMNVLPATVANGRLEGVGFALPVPPGLAAAAGTRVFVGLRPQHLVPTQASDGLQAVVEVVEPLGDESYVHCRVGEASVIVREAGHSPRKPGETLGLGLLSSEHMHVFDRETERRL